MSASDPTIEILKDIRAESRANGERIDQTNERIDLLTRRVVESEIRMSTAITEPAGTVKTMTDVLRQSHDLRPRVERCERDIKELQARRS